MFAEIAFVDVLLRLVEDSALLQGGHVKQPFRQGKKISLFVGCSRVTTFGSRMKKTPVDQLVIVKGVKIQ